MDLNPGYKRTDVGVIPEEWEVAQLRDLKPFVTSGSRGWAAYYSERGSLFVRITNMSRSSIYLDLENSKFVNLPVESSEGIRTQLQEHDLLISITADIGIVSYVDSRVPTPAYINQHIALVRFDQTKTSGKFVSYFLASERPQRLFRASTDVGAKAGMSLPTVQKLNVALPPLDEQRAIAEALSDVDALLSGLDRFIAKKRDLKQAAIQQLLTGQTRLPGFHGAWDQVCLGEMFTFKNGLNKGKEFFGFGTPIVNYMDVFGNAGIVCSKLEGRVSLSKPEIKNFNVRKGDVLFTRTSETPEEIGMASVILDEPDQTVFSGFVLRGRPKDDRLCDAFKAYCFRSSFVRKQIISKASYTTRALTNGRILSAVILPVPTPAEQTAIARVLSDMDAELAALEQRRDKTRALTGHDAGIADRQDEVGMNSPTAVPSFFVGWDVGGWNCDKNDASRDAIVILDDELSIVGRPWRGNLRLSIVSATTTGDWLAALFSKCGAALPACPREVTMAIDIPLGFSEEFVALITRRGCVEPDETSGRNRYLFRQTERHLFDRGLKPMSAIKDMIGSQATKGMHVLAKFAPKVESCGVWTDGHGFCAIETYPTACRQTKAVTSLMKGSEPLGHSDLDDARTCAAIGHLFATERKTLEGPRDDVPLNEGWIWVPRESDSRDKRGRN
ncbi:MAG: type restriction enzyme subunit [Chthoniobacter sp.]|jgi:type I restriction enzyme S subunit|nr:type restriction enzyme subunit [Chthoniobacter sp.]